jgi:hypothetical protein
VKSKNLAADQADRQSSPLQSAILLVLLFAAALVAADWFSGGVLMGAKARGLAEASAIPGTAAQSQSSGW